MLELKNVSKIYATKNSELKALNNVSLYFEETGMVFVTGKSGSGKTTLLNVIGGLDNFSSGEILIKGKSTESFSKSDYDSYRNTYVGFVFQEYNLLDNMTIEQNLSLALKLQRKQSDKILINEILNKVDLYDVASRHPTELSGGQKQRVAIARALIKNPSIIMADEPTGALDTENGEQVISLLKTLSKEKLVIVVSHDLELAERYADRIIHMKDGCIDSDYTIENADNQAANLYESEQSVSVKRKADLNDSELKVIQTALKAGKDIVVTDKISSVKKQTEIKEKKSYDGQSSFIKTKLGFKDTVALGLNTLKTKPLRLTITIILCVFAFTIFGLFDSLSVYDEGRMAENAIRYSTAPSIVMTTEMKESNNNSYEFNAGNALIESIEESTSYDVKGVYSSYYVGTSAPVELANNNACQISKYYYYKAFRGAVEFSQSDLENYKFSLVSGRLPDAFDEIAISHYFAMCMVNWSYHYKNTEGNEVIVTDIDQIVNENEPLYLTIGTTDNKTSYKIVGIIDTGEIDKKFDTFKEKDSNGEDAFESISESDKAEFLNYINNGYYLIAFVKEGFVQNALTKRNALTQYVNRAYSFPFYANDADVEISKNAFYRFDDLKNLTSNYYFFENGKTELASNEFLADISKFSDWYAGVINPLLTLAEGSDRFKNDVENIRANITTINNPRASDTDKLNALQTVISKLNEMQATLHAAQPENYPNEKCIYPLTFTAKKLDTSSYVEGTTTPKEVPLDLSEYTLAGFYYGVNLPNANTTSVIVTDDALNNFGVNLLQGEYSSLIATDLGKGQMRKMSALFFNEKGVVYKCANTAIALIKANGTQFERLSQLFWIASGIFAVFSIAMFSNFISTSIKNKYGEIGILRALGARGKDIMKMFSAETAVIALINAGFACALAWCGTILVNAYVRTYLNFYIPIANFGMRQILIIIALSMLVGIVSAVIPIAIVSKQKPVETIRKAY